jgi:excinuclease ABC subunit A
MLIENLKKLVQIGNSVVVVEHDEDIMRESDHIIDIGPRAGVHGGEVIFQGTYDQICTSRTSETGKYLSYKKSVERKNPKQVLLHIPQKAISKKSLISPHFATLSPTSPKISIVGATENNLKNVSVDIPLGVMTVVTGVSGSGKSSLIMDTLSVAAVNHFNESTHTVGKHTHISGLETLDKAIIIDQAPI